MQIIDLLGATPSDLYIRERAIEMFEKLGIELIRAGVPKFIEEVMKYVFENNKKQY